MHRCFCLLLTTPRYRFVIVCSTTPSIGECELLNKHLHSYTANAACAHSQIALLEQLLRAAWPLLLLDSKPSQQQQQQPQYTVAAQLQAAAQSVAAEALQLLGTTAKAEAPWPAAAVRALQRFEHSSAAAAGGGGYTGLLGMVAKVRWYC
jgi:hypothetical protein